jgi:hypothetical protein
MLAVITQRIRERGHACNGELATICGVNAAEAPLIPETLIYSKTDGVVDWVSCIEEGPNVRTFEVASTHCGLPYNLDTLRIVRGRIEEGPAGPYQPTSKRR